MEENKQLFRITIKHYDSKHSVETDRSDLTIYEVKELIRSVLLSVGYTERTIHEDLFNESNYG